VCVSNIDRYWSIQNIHTTNIMYCASLVSGCLCLIWLYTNAQDRSAVNLCIFLLQHNTVVIPWFSDGNTMVLWYTPWYWTIRIFCYHFTVRYFQKPWYFSDNGIKGNTTALVLKGYLKSFISLLALNVCVCVCVCVFVLQSNLSKPGWLGLFLS